MRLPRLLPRILPLLIPSMRQVRLAIFSFVVFGALALASGRAALADVKELGVGVGHELAKLEDLTGGAYVVRVNGADVHWASARTDQSVITVLDRYEEYCRSAPSALGQALKDVPAALEDRVPVKRDDPARAGIVRDSSSERGMVACFVERDRGDLSSSTERLRAALQAFATTGDLSELGHFRYVFAEKSAKTGATRVVTMWSDGPIQLGKMFPAEGDAPGTDSTLAPRPANSRRTLSATIEGFAGAVRSYEARGDAGNTLASYQASVEARGFHLATKKSPSPGVWHAAWVRADGAELFVSVSQSNSETEPRAAISVVESQSMVKTIQVEN